MKKNNSLFSVNDRIRRRAYGAHMTSINIFAEFILPEIKDVLEKYVWVDLYAGEGNLILPILRKIDSNEREKFFQDNMYLFDVQKEMVKKCIENAKSYGISKSVAENNIKERDNLHSFPEFLNELQKPLYHVTNPPYLYLGYISKHESTKDLLRYFDANSSVCQDLYQIAMMNDLKNNVGNLIYVIPTNFLYGASVSNNFRTRFLYHYKIAKMIIFETKIFKFTGTNICIGFFQRKLKPNHDECVFTGTKIYPNKKNSEKRYKLDPEFKYRAGSEFQAFLNKFQAIGAVKVNYYLLADELQENPGHIKVTLLDANKYNNGEYEKKIFRVNETLYDKITKNILYVRTVDTGSIGGRVGLHFIENDFNANGIFVSGNTYRTHPIQIFLNPEMSMKKQTLLRKYFNFVLESYRVRLDSDFLTTYKYSNASYTRKYLGLNQARKLIETFPVHMNESDEDELNKICEGNQFSKVTSFLKKYCIHS